MAITATVKEQTPYRLTYLLSQDGQAGTTFSIANATLLADSLPGSPLGNMLRMAVAAQANARSYIFGDGAPGGTGGLAGAFAVPRAHTWIQPRTGTPTWTVDANVASTAIIVTGTGPAGASDAYLYIRLSHSIDV